LYLCRPRRHTGDGKYKSPHSLHWQMIEVCFQPQVPVLFPCFKCARYDLIRSWLIPIRIQVFMIPLDKICSHQKQLGHMRERLFILQRVKQFPLKFHWKYPISEYMWIVLAIMLQRADCCITRDQDYPPVSNGIISLLFSIQNWAQNWNSPQLRSFGNTDAPELWYLLLCNILRGIPSKQSTWAAAGFLDCPFQDLSVKCTSRSTL
jgi:hypothetical protein